MLILARALQHPTRRRDVNAPDPVSFVLDALRADPNTALFKETLDAEHEKRASQRYAAEPVPHSALTPLDAAPSLRLLQTQEEPEDSRRDEWREDAKREEHEDRKARAESYGSGGFGL